MKIYKITDANDYLGVSINNVIELNGRRDLVLGNISKLLFVKVRHDNSTIVQEYVVNELSVIEPPAPIG
jgi:hypothetical protein